MLISLKNNIALLAMTKTGSTAIEAALASHCDILFTRAPQAKHMQLRRFERFIRPYLAAIDHNDIETACLIREPIDWLGSWYRYRGRPELSGHSNSTQHISFDVFARAYMQKDPPPFACVGRQSEFVRSKNDALGVTHIFKYENLEAYLAFLSDRFEIELSLEQLNVSPKRDLDISPDTLAQLKTYLADDFEIHHAAR